MPRPLRIDPPGTWHHVMNRGARRQTVFLDDRDHVRFLELLGELDDRFGVEVHLYCLVGNHYHLLVRSRDGRISEAMKFLSERFTRWSNDRHGFDGPVFRGRFHSERVSDDAHLRWLFRYIHRNARDVGWRGPLSSFPWSSLGNFVGEGHRHPPVPWLHTEVFVDLFDHDRGRMIAFLDDEDAEPARTEPASEGEGSATHVADLELARSVIRHALDSWGITPSDLTRSARGVCSEPRLAVAVVLVDHLSIPSAIVASQLALNASSCRSLLRRARQRVGAKPQFAQAVHDLRERAVPPVLRAA